LSEERIARYKVQSANCKYRNQARTMSAPVAARRALAPKRRVSIRRRDQTGILARKSAHATRELSTTSPNTKWYQQLRNRRGEKCGGL
jgi:hypothetical protein